MDKLVEIIAQKTSGKSLKSFRYSFEPLEKPNIHYPEENEVPFSVKERGETDSSIQTSRNLMERSKQIRGREPLLKYFMDGSRRTYKIDDISYKSKKKIYPILAGQIGTACCERTSERTLKKYELKRDLFVALPKSADKDADGETFFNSLTKELNREINSFTYSLTISKTIAYHDQLGKGEKYEHRAIARIHDEMIESEKEIVRCIVEKNLLNPHAYLLKDGSL